MKPFKWPLFYVNCIVCLVLQTESSVICESCFHPWRPSLSYDRQRYFTLQHTPIKTVPKNGSPGLLIRQLQASTAEIFSLFQRSITLNGSMEAYNYIVKSQYTSLQDYSWKNSPVLRRSQRHKRDLDSHEDITRISHVSLELQKLLPYFIPPHLPTNIQSTWLP